MSADDLGRPFGKAGAWVEARTGIRQLRRARSADDLPDLAYEAATRALADADIAAAQVDLVIVASCSSLTRHRALSEVLVQRLGTRCGYLDLNAACSGFCYSLSVADSMIRTGSAEHVLVVAAEHMSGMVDPKDLATAIVFADGAGAAVLGPSGTEQPGVGPTVWGSAGERRDLIDFDHFGQFLRMRGPEVFRWAVDAVPEIARAACERARVRLEDVDVFVPHQANLRIIEAVVRRLPLRSDAVVATDVAESGNTSAASVPIALDKLRRSGSVSAGALGLLVGFGAGLAHAAQVVRLP